MSSNSPVLLLAPSAVPTAPIMAPLLKPDMRPRAMLPAQFAQDKAVEAPAGTKLNLKLTHDATESKSGEVSPVAPTMPTVSSAAASPSRASVPVAKAESPGLAPAVPLPKVAVTANSAPIAVLPTPADSKPTAFAATTNLLASPRPSAPVAAHTRASPLTPTTTSKRAAAASPSSPTSSALVASPKSSPSSPSSPKAVKSSTGRWTEAEHKLFLKGLEQFPYRAWKKIATLIKTRTVVQIRTHAQKYYQKLEKEEQRMREREAQLASQQGLASVVSTPRVEVPSVPSTPAAAASTSFQEVSLGGPMVMTPSAAAAASTSAGTFDDFDAPQGAVGKRKAQMRKRKGSADDFSDVPSSLPKRMMKEKKFIREKTMSPKQKTAVSNSRVFGFGDFADASSGDDSAKASSSRGLSVLKTHPLDFDDDEDVTNTTTGMMLDFTEEKPMVDFPFPLDTALERGLAGIDQEDLLQLSDDEGMEWFSAAESVDQDDLMDAVDSSVGSPLTMDGQSLSPLYSEAALHFVDPAPITIEASPSPILASSADCADFALNGDVADDDEDFVLDPEKFLSSYFNPEASL